MELTIEQLEEAIGSYLQTQDFIEFGLAVRITQDLGPVVADFLHSKGVSIDWSDGSRFGKA